jgi:hypothetical protein
MRYTVSLIRKTTDTKQGAIAMLTISMLVLLLCPGCRTGGDILISPSAMEDHYATQIEALKKYAPFLLSRRESEAVAVDIGKVVVRECDIPEMLEAAVTEMDADFGNYVSYTAYSRLEGPAEVSYDPRDSHKERATEEEGTVHRAKVTMRNGSVINAVEYRLGLGSQGKRERQLTVLLDYDKLRAKGSADKGQTN